MALFDGWPAVSGAATFQEIRKSLAGQVVRDAAGVMRKGIFPTTAAALVTGTATMNVAVASFVAALDRNGLVLVANEGAANVLLSSAPASGSRWSVVYVKQQETEAPFSDAANGPILSRVESTTSAAAARALLPAGALELALVQVNAGSANTNAAGVTITQTASFTAMAGGIVWVRDATELAAWTPADGALAWRIDTAQSFQRQGGAWLPLLRGKTAFIPSWVNFLVGPSAVSAWWQTVGNVCEGRAKVTLASGYSLSSSGIEMNPPIPAANPSDGAPIGQATYIDAGVAYYNGALMQGASGTLRLMHFGASSAAAATSGTAPFGFGVSDSFQLAWRYEV